MGKTILFITSLLFLFSCIGKQFSSADLKNYLQGKWRVSYFIYSDEPADTFGGSNNYLYIFKGDSLITGPEEWIYVKENIPYHVRKTGVLYSSGKKIHFILDGKKGPPLKINIISPSQCEWIAKEGGITVANGLERLVEY